MKGRDSRVCPRLADQALGYSAEYRLWSFPLLPTDAGCPTPWLLSTLGDGPLDHQGSCRRQLPECLTFAPDLDRVDKAHPCRRSIGLKDSVRTKDLPIH